MRPMDSSGGVFRQAQQPGERAWTAAKRRVWEQEKLEASLSWPTGQGKMLAVGAARRQRRQSYTSGACGGRRLYSLNIMGKLITIELHF